jgi:hypothetical protein
MENTEELLWHLYDSTRWYHERSAERRCFDVLVTAGLKRGWELPRAIEVAVLSMPEAKCLIAGNSPEELEDYYRNLRALELDIAIADTAKLAIKLRKSRREKKSGTDEQKGD